MATHVYHTTINYIDPLYPDILDKYIGRVFECSKMPKIIRNNMQTQVYTSCDITSRVPYYFYAPDHAGFKIASKPSDTYIILNVHLENHDDHDTIVSPSMRIWHTGKLRQNDLDMLTIGEINNYDDIGGGIGIMIPPYEPRFITRSVIDMYCYKDVSIYFLHSSGFGSK